MHRGEKPLDNNTFVLKCDPKLAKPELKQFLTKGKQSSLSSFTHTSHNYAVYGLDLQKVNTVRYTGKIRSSVLRSKINQPSLVRLSTSSHSSPPPLAEPFKTRDFKKVYAVLKTEVDPFFQKVETM